MRVQLIKIKLKNGEETFGVNSTLLVLSDESRLSAGWFVNFDKYLSVRFFRTELPNVSHRQKL